MRVSRSEGCGCRTVSPPELRPDDDELATDTPECRAGSPPEFLCGGYGDAVGSCWERATRANMSHSLPKLRVVKRPHQPLRRQLHSPPRLVEIFYRNSLTTTSTRSLVSNSLT